MVLEDYKVKADRKGKLDSGGIRYHLKLVDKNSSEVVAESRKVHIEPRQEQSDTAFRNVLEGWGRRKVGEVEDSNTVDRTGEEVEL